MALFGTSIASSLVAWAIVAANFIWLALRVYLARVKRPFAH
jgi:hypothetical protein